MVRRLGELEAAIMDVLWAADRPLLVREVRARLDQDWPHAFTTVQTVLSILHRKGWADRSLTGRAYRYRPGCSREEYVAALMNDALSATPDRAKALAKFVEQMDPDEAVGLRQALAGTSASKR